jgi:hypothetical protein
MPVYSRRKTEMREESMHFLGVCVECELCGGDVCRVVFCCETMPLMER